MSMVKDPKCDSPASSEYILVTKRRFTLPARRPAREDILLLECACLRAVAAQS